MSFQIFALTCEITTSASCSDSKILYLQNDSGGWSNAHAQQTSVASYSNVLCCEDSSFVVNDSCSLGTNFLDLSASDNAHVERVDQGNYLVDACLYSSGGLIDCNYSTSCSADQTCLLSMVSVDGTANLTNAHLGNCSDYSTKVCCGIDYTPHMNSVEILPSHLTIDSDLQAYCNASDSDDSSVTFYFSWYKNDVLNKSGSYSGASINESVNVDNLSSSKTSLNDIWMFSCSAGDGSTNSSSINTSVLIGGNLSIEVNPVFSDSSSSHSFTVLAGASHSKGASYIKNTSITYSSGSCVYLSNQTSGNYFNVTYNCSGTPFSENTVSITFCDDFDQCNTTISSSNKYPNQIPVLGSLLTPSSGNDSLIDRTVNFSWSSGSDPDGDPINYTLKLINDYCSGFETSNISKNYYLSGELHTIFECQNNVYEWQLKVCDAWNCSSYSSLQNFSIQDYLEISITNDEINFSTLDLDQEEDTSDNSPSPFIFENTGNIKANLTGVNSSGVWSSVGLDNSYYQFKARNSSEDNSFNWSASLTTWFNMTDGEIGRIVIGSLDYHTSSNEAYMDIHLRVPPSEPPGSKTDVISFVWESAE